MRLFTKDIDKKLFEQYKYGSDLSQQKVIAKIFNPYSKGTWYLLNSDPNDSDYIWAIVDLIDIEMGSVSRSELESIKVPPFRLPLERDTSFTTINALELYRGLKQGKRYADGGTTDFKPDVEIVENKIGKNYLFPKGGNPDTMGIEFARGGNIKSFKKEEAYRLTPYNSIERSIMERVPNEKEYKLAGNFYIKGHNNDAYIYFLDEFDRDYVKGVDINPNERIYRYITRNSAIGGMMPLIKINVENGLVYYPIFKDEDVLVGFDRRGQKTEYLNLIEADESDYYANGGSTDSSEDFIISDGSGMYYSRNLTNGNVKWNDSQDMAYMFSKGEAESIKSKLESEGYSNLSVQKYDKEWWKKMENGGEIKWQDVYRGDSALVVSENKLGVVIKPYGRKFHLRFPDGTEKTYDASELKFIKDEEYANGGKTEEGVDLFEDYDDIPENVQKVLDKHSVAFEDGDYRDLEKAHKDLLKIGYTFEYGLDGEAYDLRKVGQKGKSESYAKGGYMASGGKLDVGRYYKTKDGRQVRYLGDTQDPEVGTFMNKADGVFKVRYDEIGGKDSLFADGGYMAEGGMISGLTADEAIYLYVKKALVQKYREKYLKPAGLWNTPKSKDVEQSLIKKGFLNNAGAITESGKNKAREVDSEIGQMISREYISGMNTLAEYRKLVEKFGSGDKMAKGGKTESEETVYIEYLNKAKKFAKDKKEFKGEDSYKEAISWGRKNIPNFNADMVKFKMADGDYMAKTFEVGYEINGKKEKSLYSLYPNDRVENLLPPTAKIISIKEKLAKGGMMADGGIIPIEKKGDKKVATIIHDGNVFFVEYYIDNPELKHIKGTDANTYFSVVDNKYSYGKKNKEYIAVTKKLINAIKNNKVAYYEDGGKMAMGGKVTFADKVKSIKSSLLKRKKVSPSVQKDYGKTYSPKEAEESAKRIVGAMLKKRQMK